MYAGLSAMVAAVTPLGVFRAAQVVSLLSTMISLELAGRMVERGAGRFAARVCVGALSCTPLVLEHAVQPMSDALGLLFCMGTLVIILGRRSRLGVAFAGGSVALAVLSRPAALVLTGWVVVAAAFLPFFGLTWRQRASTGAIVAVAGLLPLWVWARWLGSPSPVHALHPNITSDAILITPANLLSHVGPYLRHLLTRAPIEIGATAPAWIVAAACVGFCLLWFNRTHFWVGLVSFGFAYAAGVSWFPFEARYSLPLAPVFSALVGLAAASLVERVARPHAKAFLTTALGALGVAMVLETRTLLGVFEAETVERRPEREVTEVALRFRKRRPDMIVGVHWSTETYSPVTFELRERGGVVRNDSPIRPKESFYLYLPEEERRGGAELERWLVFRDYFRFLYFDPGAVLIERRDKGQWLAPMRVIVDGRPAGVLADGDPRTTITATGVAILSVDLGPARGGGTHTASLRKVELAALPAAKSAKSGAGPLEVYVARPRRELSSEPGLGAHLITLGSLDELPDQLEVEVREGGELAEVYVWTDD